MEQVRSAEPGVSMTRDGICGQARKLVADARNFDEVVKAVREGFEDAAKDEPWFSASGWGMLKQPAPAANEADAFTRSVIGEIDHMGLSASFTNSPKATAALSSTSGEN